ncbi:hypothetical protein F5X97DRAFT_178406 [Nemania serpens]|nr:hypothetical protein F5X97DRAFT_178406 [Nemania serpens]
MAFPIYTPESSHRIADDEMSGYMLTYPECGDLFQSAGGSSFSTIPTHYSETETVSSQDDEWAIPEPTDSLSPTSSGRSYKRKATITVINVDGQDILPNQPSGLSSQNSDRARVLSFIKQEGSSATARDSVTGLPMNGIIVGNNSSEFASADEPIDRLGTDLNGPDSSVIHASGIGDNLVPPRTVAVAGSLATDDVGLLKDAIIRGMANRSLLSSRQLGNVLSLQKLRDVCILYKMHETCSPSFFAHFNPVANPQPQQDTSVSSKDIVDSILQVITLGLDGSAPKPRCWVYGPRLGVADIAALRFGLNSTIVLYNLENTTIKFVCCDETFPSSEWAEEAAREFLRGAEPWAKAGLTFERVARSEAAHFRIAFSLFPSDLDCSMLAQAFFPGTTQPTQRTLWVYLLAFHPSYRPHMAGYMGHEAGHIGGARHGFDEHLLPDGSEIPELKSVTMGADSPSSVMNYHNDLDDFVVQPSDTKDMMDMRGHPEDEYQGYKIIKVEPENEVYSQMTSFESIAVYLSTNT